MIGERENESDVLFEFLANLPMWVGCLLALIFFGAFFYLTVSMPDAVVATQADRFVAAVRENLWREFDWMTTTVLPFICPLVAAVTLLLHLVSRRENPQRQ